MSIVMNFVPGVDMTLLNRTLEVVMSALGVKVSPA